VAAARQLTVLETGRILHPERDSGAENSTIRPLTRQMNTMMALTADKWVYSST
jgi:hypothetical protein